MEAKFSLSGAASAVKLSASRHRVAVFLWTVLSLLEARALDRFDADFAAKLGTGANRSISAVIVDNQSRIVVAGSFTEFNGIPAPGLVRLNPDGTLDPSFVPNLVPDRQGIPRILAIHRDGYVVATSHALEAGGGRGPAIWRLNGDGSVDATFADNRLRFQGGTLLAVAADSQGRILAAGSFSLDGTIPKLPLVRLLQTGQLDAGFLTPSMRSASALTVLADGRIVVGAGDTEDGVHRLWPDGEREWPLPRVNAREEAPHQILPLPDGRLLVSNVYRDGTRSDFGLVRLGPNLEPDYTLDTRDWLSGWNRIGDVVAASDGTIYALHTTIYPIFGELVRLRPDGGIDPRFPRLSLRMSDWAYNQALLVMDSAAYLLVSQPTSGSG